MSKVAIENSALYSIGNAIRRKLSVETHYKPSEMPAAITSIESYPEPTGAVSITENGTANVKDYATAIVNVPNTYEAEDEGKVVDNGALVEQTSQTFTQNGTYDTTTNDEVVVNVTAGGTFVTKTITENGTYDPADDNADGYSEVTVNVSGGDVLPSAYQEVEYLLIGDTATYIEVEYYRMVGDVISGNASCENWSARQYMSMLGTYDNHINIRADYGAKNGKRYFWASSGIAYKADDHSVYSTGSELTFGGTLASHELLNFSIMIEMGNADATVYYGVYSSVADQYLSNAKIYPLTIVRNDGTTAIHLVPCYRISDSVCGFYDLRSGRFYTAVRGGYTAGPDVT